MLKRVSKPSASSSSRPPLSSEFLPKLGITHYRIDPVVSLQPLSSLSIAIFRVNFTQIDPNPLFLVRSSRRGNRGCRILRVHEYAILTQ